MTSIMRFEKWENTTGTRSLNIAQATPGLTPITPTSIAVGSGSATTNAIGTVAFTGVSSVSLNNVFTSAYTNYQIIISSLYGSSDGAAVGFRYRASGTDLSTATYYQAGYSSPNSNGAIQNWGTGASSFGDLGRSRPSSASTFAETLTCYSPAVSGVGAKTLWTGWWENSTSGYFITAGHIVNNTLSYDGFTIFPSSGTITGTFTVYGYNG